MSTQAALFDAKEAERLKELGISRAQSTRAKLVETAQAFAAMIAMNEGEVSMDDVFRVMTNFNRHPELLGNAAGSVFKAKRFQWTGRWIKSKRVSNHGRAIRVWRLK